MKISECRNLIVKAIRANQKQVSVKTCCNTTKELLGRLVDYDPKLLAYISHIRMVKSHAEEKEFFVDLINLDISFGELSVVRKADQMIWKLCNDAGRFRKKVVMVCEKQFDAEAAYERFFNEKTSFYPGLRSVKLSRSVFVHYAYQLVTVDMTYRIGTVQLKMLELEIEKEAERVANLLFTKDMPDYVKVYLAHNYLTTSIVYSAKQKRDPLKNNYIHSAYGALILKDCVCQGFSEAYKRLLDKAGVPCEVVSGQVIGSDEYHAWNIVSLGHPAKSYHVDTTWDGGELKNEYTYFCVTDSYLRGKRVWDKHFGITCCFNGATVLQSARSYVKANKSRLLARGIPRNVLDC